MGDHPDSNPNLESPSDDDDTTTATSSGATGRFYGCNFCRRGFTTSQALGGHMNIHRKERGKTRRKSSPSTSAGVDERSGHGFYRGHDPCATFGPHFSHSPATSASSTSGARALDHKDVSAKTARRLGELRLFGEELGAGYGEEMKSKEDEVEGGVDLELRLGRYYA